MEQLLCAAQNRSLQNIGYLLSAKKINIYVYKNHNIIIVFSCLPYHKHLLFHILLLVGIYGIYLKFDLGPLVLISILFINIAIVM